MIRLRAALRAPWRIVAVLFLAALVVTGCAGPSAAALRAALPSPAQTEPLAGSQTFVGRSGELAVAVVLGADGAAVAYACDGLDRWGWFGGRVDGATVALTGDAGRLDATITGDTLVATVQVRGETLPVELRKAGPGAGLFHAARGPVEFGWIVTNDGEITGAASRAEQLSTVAGTRKGRRSSDRDDAGSGVAAGGRPDRAGSPQRGVAADRGNGAAPTNRADVTPPNRPFDPSAPVDEGPPVEESGQGEKADADPGEGLVDRLPPRGEPGRQPPGEFTDREQECSDIQQQLAALGPPGTFKDPENITKDKQRQQLEAKLDKLNCADFQAPEQAPNGGGPKEAPVPAEPAPSGGPTGEFADRELRCGEIQLQIRLLLFERSSGFKDAAASQANATQIEQLNAQFEALDCADFQAPSSPAPSGAVKGVG